MLRQIILGGALLCGVSQARGGFNELDWVKNKPAPEHAEHPWKKVEWAKNQFGSADGEHRQLAKKDRRYWKAQARQLKVELEKAQLEHKQLEEETAAAAETTRLRSKAREDTLRDSAQQSYKAEQTCLAKLSKCKNGDQEEPTPSPEYVSYDQDLDFWR